MLDWISKKRRDKKRKEAREKTLKKSLAEKVLKYDNHIGESKNDFTEITIGGEILRVAIEQITLTDLWTEQNKSSNC
jgi:hypothetical protein